MARKAFSRIAITLLLMSALPVVAGPADTWRASLKEVDQKLRAQEWEAAGSRLARWLG